MIARLPIQLWEGREVELEGVAARVIRVREIRGRRLVDVRYTRGAFAGCRLTVLDEKLQVNDPARLAG